MNGRVGTLERNLDLPQRRGRGMTDDGSRWCSEQNGRKAVAQIGDVGCRQVGVP
jgi:hypothetical protein